jgi:DNA helicase-2/ATP-dependent DNA helicase PcrA
MIDYERFLNPEQLEAVTAGDGPLLVLAAAGTGKTQTLVYRVAHLIGRGVSPAAILLLTFTNRAAREMLERARSVAGDSVGDVWGGTFHHVCNRMLRRHAPRLGYRHDFIIADRDDSRKLIDDCVKELKLGGKEFPGKDVLAGLFSHAVNRDELLEDVVGTRLDHLCCDINDVCRVQQRYIELKEKLGVMDFDDLLLNGLRLITEHEDIRRLYQEQFRHILVDEYQDTNLLQARFVDTLVGSGDGNIMVVGDDFQCIYSWRGADFRNIMSFPERYPNARIVRLERNYRSVPGILEVANASIANNPEQFQKTLRATRGGGEKPVLHVVRDGREQAEVIGRLIWRYQQRGHSLRDMAVLYRAHFHAIELQLALTRASIPFVITSGIGLFEQAHIKDVLSLLRLAHDPQDRLAFDRLICLLPGVGPRTAATLWHKLGSACDCRNPARRAQLAGLLRPAAREGWEVIDRALALYYEEGPRARASMLIGDFVKGYYEEYLTKTYDNAQDRIDDVYELGPQIDQSESVEAFLQEVALLTNTDQVDGRERGKQADAIRLSTVHQAKGLEWPVVFIIWAVEGMFPSGRAVGELEDDAEERRLFYVATTRAREALHIMAPQWRQLKGSQGFFCKPSRFVTEIPNRLLHTRYGLQF